MQTKLLEKDLEFIFEHTKGLYEDLRGKTILITGASGLVGSWMLDSLVYAENKLKLDITIHALTRDIDRFYTKLPHLKKLDHVLLFPIKGDIRKSNYPCQYDYVLHFATHEGHRLNIEDPLEMFDVIANGTWKLLKFANEYRFTKFLYMSSGVVTKKEDNVYIEGKKVGELLCNLYHKQYGMDIKIARGYDFVGARLPLDKHFAIGNFIGNVLKGETVEVKSDGMAVRSYLYMADVVVWLWTILFKGKACVPYNVGSNRSLTIGNLAKKVSIFGDREVYMKGDLKGMFDVYVSSFGSAEHELGLKQYINLDESIKRTIEWYKENDV